MLFSFSSCAAKLSPEEKEEFLCAIKDKNYDQLNNFSFSNELIASSFDADDSYFFALRYIEAKNTKKAHYFLEYGKENASPFFSKLCFEKLIEIGLKSQKIHVAKEYAKTFPKDQRAMLILSKVLFTQNKAFEAYNVFTSVLPPLEEKNQDLYNSVKARSLIYLLETDISLFSEAFLAWATEAEITKSFEDFIDLFEKLPESKKTNAIVESSSFFQEFGGLEKIITLLKMRLAVFDKWYSTAFSFSKELDLALKTKTSAILSDYGKSLIYGGADLKESSKVFEEIASDAKDSSVEYVAWFYCARFCERTGERYKALDVFSYAMNAAKTELEYDNALWYYLDCAKKVSFSTTIQSLKKYASTWHDAEYFEDFFLSFAADLLTTKAWDDFLKVYEIILPFADKNTLAQYGYVSARLLEEELSHNPFDIPEKKVIEEGFNNAFNGGISSLYYRFLASQKLNIPVESVSSLSRDKKLSRNSGEENFIKGLAIYGFLEELLPFMKENYDSIGVETAIFVCNELIKNEKKYTKAHTDSLRIITYATRNSDVKITKEVLEFLYPRPFYAELKAACEKFNLEEYILYGLTRSESFFDKDVVSSAGAIGLSQLMPGTAGDVAKKLKISDYDLRDASTNLLFGAFYISDLIRRLEDSSMLALFAYNAGPTPVRRWIKASKDLPIDLFLETVPYTETRDYGRKVLAASACYGYLYYDKTPHQVVKEIMGDSFE